MNFKAIILLFITLCLFSCKKRVEKERPEFIGFWIAKGEDSNFYYDITIENNSNAIYREHCMLGSSNVTIRGKARANDKKLKIGRISNFKIEEYPHKIDTVNSNIYVPNPNYSYENCKKANWKMVLKGPKFYLGSGTYYKADY